jgi:hypothetical protein
MKLVIFKDNWADEMYISGWEVMKEKHWNKIVEVIQNKKEQFEVYFGTNEFNVYKDGNDFLTNFTVFDITEEESRFLDRVFSGYRVRGNFPSVWEYWEE